MLVSFKVKNHRSFAEEQTFSLVAGTASKKEERIAFETPNNFAPHLLRSACVFGANGSGKSSLLDAMTFFKRMIIYSSSYLHGDKIPVNPYRLDADFRNAPSEFEIIFICEQGLYQYGFAVDKDRVHEEWLFHRPNAEKTALRRLFQRSYDTTAEKYEWYINNAFVKGEKESWKNQTTDNVLFLSRAVQLNAQEFKEPFHWVGNNLQIIAAGGVSSHFTVRNFSDPKSIEKIVNLMRSADIAIEDLKVEINDNIPMSKKIAEQLGKMPETEARRLKEILTQYTITTYQQDRSGEKIAFDLHDDESDGTKCLYSLVGLWFDSLDTGKTLFIDELHNSLHPHLQKALIGLFNNPAINKNNAQLIFTSHDTTAINNIMHRDQIWFTEKTKKQGTELFPLSDYKIRSDIDNYQKSYLDGRYGGIPHIEELIESE